MRYFFLKIILGLLRYNEVIETIVSLFNHLLEKKQMEGIQEKSFRKDELSKTSVILTGNCPMLLEKSPSSRESARNIKCLTTLFFHLFSPIISTHPISSFHHYETHGEKTVLVASRQMKRPFEYRFSNQGSILLECSGRS